MTITIAPEPKLSDRATAEILTPSALEFLADLHRRFEPRRQELLAARRGRPAPRLPARNRGREVVAVAGPIAAGRLRGPPGGDHRADRSKNGYQCVELRR